MDENDRPWLVIQQRVHADVDFYRDWDTYETGFGVMNPRNSFWMGNKLLNALTNNGETWRLRVDLESMFDGDQAYALYSSFSMADATDKYRLSIGTYSGTAGNSLRAHDDMQFTTFDQDNDRSGSNCAVAFKGGWWSVVPAGTHTLVIYSGESLRYNSCHSANLNGLFFEGTTACLLAMGR